NPHDAAVLLAIAQCEAGLGRREQALVWFNKVLSMKPEDHHILFQIAVFYEFRLARRNEALTWLSRAVERGQTWTEIDRAPALRDLRKDSGFERLRRGG